MAHKGTRGGAEPTAPDARNPRYAPTGDRNPLYATDLATYNVDHAKWTAAKRGFDDHSHTKIHKKGSGGKRSTATTAGKATVDATAGRQGSIQHGKHSVETAGGKLKSPHSMTLKELFNV